MRLGRFQLPEPFRLPVHAEQSLQPETMPLSLFQQQLVRDFSGGRGEVVTPVPIPNTEVKGLIGEGTAGVARGRVARRRNFFLIWRREQGTGNEEGDVWRKRHGCLARCAWEVWRNSALEVWR